MQRTPQQASKPASYQERLELPVGYEDPASGQIWTDAEVRAINGSDELAVGMSADYNRYPNDLVYKNLMLARAVVRIGGRTIVTQDDIRRLHARDLRALEEAIFRLTYGDLPQDAVTCPSCGHGFHSGSRAAPG
jgi:hypothetical protein